VVNICTAMCRAKKSPVHPKLYFCVAQVQKMWLFPSRIVLSKRSTLCSSGGTNFVYSDWILAIFMRFRKSVKRNYQLRHICPSVSLCPSVRMEQLGQTGRIRPSKFVRILQKSLAPWLKFHSNLTRNGGYSAWRPIYSFDNISLISSYEEMLQTHVLERIFHIQ